MALQYWYNLPLACQQELRWSEISSKTIGQTRTGNMTTSGFICTVVLDFTYMRQYNICFSLSKVPQPIGKVEVEMQTLKTSVWIPSWGGSGWDELGD